MIWDINRVALSERWDGYSVEGFSADNARILLLDRDGLAALILNDREPEPTIPKSNLIAGLAGGKLPAGTLTLVNATGQRAVYFLDSRSRTATVEMEYAGGPVAAAALNSGGTRACVSDSAAIYLLDALSGKLIKTVAIADHASEKNFINWKIDQASQVTQQGRAPQWEATPPTALPPRYANP